MDTLPTRKAERVVGETYLFEGEERLWDGRILRCVHGGRKSRCRDCGGGGFCKHDVIRSRCIQCDGGEICEHKTRRSSCKQCGGGQICEHGNYRGFCRECGGSQICVHDKRKASCRECGGSMFCAHGNRKYTCRECGGKGICHHNREKMYCKECGGNGICKHNRIKYVCKECEGGAICEHDRVRTFCKECGGGAICEHDHIRYSCMICDPNSTTAGVLRARIREALKGERKASSSTELLGCSIEECRQYLEEQFEDGMTWDNHGKDLGMWHIDHRRPCHSFHLLYEDEQRKCFHHTNLQPLWADENISKSNYFDEDSFEWQWTGEKWEFTG